MKHRLSMPALALAAALLATSPSSHAAVKTWYITGHMLADNGGAPLDPRLAAAFASDGSFQGSFSFSTTATALELIPGTRTDFVSSAGQGGATTLSTTNGSYTTNSSRVITQYSFNGESLTLNANALPSGPAVPGLDLVALDLFSINHFGPGNAPDAEKWPWFNPGSRVSLLPDLSSLPADAVPHLLFTFNDPQTGNSLARIGLVDALSLTAPAPVPEPASGGLLAAGLGVVAWLARRRCWVWAVGCGIRRAMTWAPTTASAVATQVQNTGASIRSPMRWVQPMEKLLAVQSTAWRPT